MNTKEQWVDEVLNSLEGIKRAEPRSDLFSEISRKLPNQKTRIIPLKRLKWVAAAACIVLAVNIYVFSTGIQQKKASTPEISYTNGLLTNYSIYK